MSSSDHASTATSTQSVKAKSDPTWEHCAQIPYKKEGGKPRLKCLYCAKEFAGKEALYRADLAIGRWLYDCCISINAVNFIYYQPMVDAIVAIGPGYKALNYHATRSKILQDIKKEVQLLVDECRSFWVETGCTIMADVKDAQNLYNLFMDMVAFVGANNVVHLVTDNAANYKVAGRLLNDKYPSIFWSPCAAHCLNLILADISKMEIITSLAAHASVVLKFIYNHAFLLAWFKKREGWVEIIRPGATRFATTFIALKSIYEYKHDIQALITSKAFTNSRYSKDQKAKDVTMIVLDNKFWNDCKIIVEIVKPLI
ncbi:uncharacterized protein LOC129310777 [Prosopis cineraria]|uniref:uncharacterized protein LOC129310777 n=1 Tax=Prosopis cineraria TaxID=364024 RepID=UPI00240F3AE7|nr:uncharacterized protein LOC129310777 [Prosopis cineraria]